MIVPSIAALARAHAPADDVEYLHELARLVLVTTLTVAALLYVARGGSLVRLAGVRPA